MEREISSASPRKTQAGTSPAVLLKTIWGIGLKNWYWFALSLAVAMAVAMFKVFSQVPVYQRTVSILVKPLGGEGSDKTLRELGISQTSTNLTNEHLMMKSGVVAEQIVRRLNLDVDYTRKGKFYDIPLYGRDLPVNLLFCDLENNERASLTTALEPDGSLTLEGWSKNGQSLPDPGLLGHLGDTLETPLGRIVAQPHDQGPAALALVVAVEDLQER